MADADEALGEQVKQEATEKLIARQSHELASLALQNKKLLYHLLLQTSAATLLEVARDPKHLGAEIGFFSVLHTWNQKLEHHPHVHCVVPAGGLSLARTHWIPSRSRFFLPVKVPSRIFRGKFVAALKRNFRQGKLGFHANLRPLAHPKAFSAWIRTLFRNDWHVYSKRPFGGAEHALCYLGHYTHRVAISNHRLVSLADDQVTFRWRDSAHHNEHKLMLRNLMESERLIVADVNLLPPTFPALGRWASDLRKRFADKCIVILEDNFHLLELPGFDAGEAKIAASSHYIKRMCTNYQITVLATMEITKSDLTPGKRPVISNLKGSSALPYDINANLAVHNDLADLMDASQIFWNDANDLTMELGANGVEFPVATKKPILEIVVDKNKISGFKGTTFFEMKPESGHLRECSIEDQGRFRLQIQTQMTERRQARAANSKKLSSEVSLPAPPALLRT